MAIFNTIYRKSSSETPDFTIEIATPPTKTLYYAGEPFAPAGMVVRGKFSNGLTIDIPHEYLVFSPSGELTLDDNRITATFQSGSVQLVAYQDISVEEMPEFMWWSPEMTSDTTPTPYKAEASSFLSTEGVSFYAFNGFNTNLNTCWHSWGGTNQWLQIDFGGTVRFSSFRMTPSNYHSTHLSYMPKNFTIELRRGTVWETVKTYSNVTGWKNNEAKSFEIADDYPLSAEAFRIKVTSVQGGSYVAIGSIEFYAATKQ